MSNFSTPDLCDDHPNEVKVLDPIFTNYGGRTAFCGEVITIKCHEDNSLVKQLAAEPGKQRVMVVDGGGSLRRALLGDMIAENAMKNGWSGLLIYGCIRDCDEIAALDLGVKAVNTIPVKTEKRGFGDLNLAVTFAGQTIESGNWLYSDNNGVIVSKQALF
ncbi:ribonuclease E activity regulator RraA [Marinicella sp. S1101]|uniref:ribonuclease E activity regulator RraA n=1 Tax=Marinicella marina TaxID=2996016 RepID=UPI002260FFE6|nr:ribonuclease E activity regulator RraA [Marinicella marina]MCX7553896.1 ribonuclease E activity regulator RraA [Marinicella marina]MDJ1140388.1 ribonuclease E activity regulator RraA [Marinicella marina]